MTEVGGFGVAAGWQQVAAESVKSCQTGDAAPATGPRVLAFFAAPCYPASTPPEVAPFRFSGSQIRSFSGHLRRLIRKKIARHPKSSQQTPERVCSDELGQWAKGFGGKAARG